MDDERFEIDPAAKAAPWKLSGLSLLVSIGWLVSSCVGLHSTRMLSAKCDELRQHNAALVRAIERGVRLSAVRVDSDCGLASVHGTYGGEPFALTRVLRPDGTPDGPWTETVPVQSDASGFCVLGTRSARPVLAEFADAVRVTYPGGIE